MHRTAERLKAIYGDKIDIENIWNEVVTERPFFSINSEFFRKAFFDKIYAAALLLNKPTGAKGPEEDGDEERYIEPKFSCPITDNVPSSQYENLMHICHRCLRAGRSEAQARNIMPKYFVFSGDEAGVEKLVCMTCHNTWTR